VLDTSMSGYAVTVDGVELGDPSAMPLVHITVEQSVRLPDMFTLEVLDPDFALLDGGRFPVGGKVEISMFGADDLTVVTAGEITALTHDGARLEVRGFDPAHRLHRGPRTTTYVQMTDSDIATRIARDHSLTADVDGTTEVHEYVVQYNQTDYSFLAERAESIGYDLWVADGTLNFKRKAESPSSLGLQWKENLLELRVRLSAAERSDTVIVRGWDHLAKQPLEGRSSDRDTGTTAPVSDDFTSRARDAFGSVTRTLASRPFSSQSEADELARSLALLASGGEVTMRGVCRGDASLRAGGTVDITGIGDQMSGEYYVTQVVHTLRPEQGYRSRFIAGPKDSAELVDLLGGGPATRRAPGPVFARVTDNEDPEQAGRVKVEYGHLRGTESTWAPVVSAGAGPDRGVQFLPEIGDEVVVIFERDDPAHPIVIGGLWNREDPPPEPAAAAGGEIHRRHLRSREGHRLVFDDDAPGRVQLALGDESCALHLEGSHSRLTGDQKLTVEGTDIEVVAAGSLILKGTRIEIEASADVKVTGSIIRLN
jgi:phage protein D/phage baseplate assembly protein gpV